MLLTEFLDEIYSPLKGICGRTADLYRFTIGAFGKSIGKAPGLEDLDELKIARFLAQRTRSRQPATAAKDRAQLRALWEFAARRGLVSTWPTMPKVKVPERVPQCWLTDEMRKIFESAALESGELCGIPAAAWWKAILLVCYDTGERIGAVQDLRWSQVLGGSILFRAESRKGGRRDILRDIGPETAAALDAIRLDRSGQDLVFPWPKSHTYMWRKFGDILRRAGLSSDRGSKFHKIRKTTASYYEAAGGSAQKLLDHSSPATTRRYLDPRVVRQRSAPDVLPKVS